MNTSRPTPFANPGMPMPLHSSVRTALSQNTDMTSGLRTQVLTTSKLVLSWVSGEVVIQAQISRVELACGQSAEPARSRDWGAE